MTTHFERQADSTHVLIYGNPAGELLATYWPSEAAAQAERESVLALQASEGMEPHARVESVLPTEMDDDDDMQRRIDAHEQALMTESYDHAFGE